MTGLPAFILTIILFVTWDYGDETTTGNNINSSTGRSDEADSDPEISSSSANQLLFWASLNGIRFLIQFFVFTFMVVRQVDMSTNSSWKKIKDSLQNVATLWIFIGMFFVLTASDKETDSGSAFYFVLGIISLEVFSFFLPCVLLVLLLPFVCFCLPFVLRNWVEIQGNQQLAGGKKDMSKLPVVVYGVVNEITLIDPEKKRDSKVKSKKATSKNKVPGGVILSIDLTEHEQQEATDSESCPICLATFKQGETLRLLPCPGTHYFHKECIDDWLKLNDTCPCCRCSVFSKDSDKFLFQLAKRLKTAQGDKVIGEPQPSAPKQSLEIV